MRLRTFAGLLVLCGGLAGGASAQVRDDAARAVLPNAMAEESDPAPTEPGEKQDNSWRYVYYNQQWWYYLPSKQWVVWNGGRWVTAAEFAKPAIVGQQRFRTGHRGTQMHIPHQPQPIPDPYLGRPIYRRFFPNMPFVPFPEDPTTSQPVTGAGQR